MRIGGVFSVYEGESPLFLKQSLKSILRNQTRDLDACVGVVEGNVGEELIEVCKDFPEVTWLEMEEFDGFGLPRALNIAVEAIDTEVVLKIDTDDIYSPMRVEWTYSAFIYNKRSPETIILICLNLRKPTKTNKSIFSESNSRSIKWISLF